MLTIEHKEDSTAKLEAVQGKPTKNFLFAQEVNQIVEEVNSIGSALNPDRIISLGTETVDGNTYTYEGYTWQLDGSQIDNIGNPIDIVLPSATTGYKRNDISVFKADGTIERIPGTETNGETATTPDVPDGTLYFKTYFINGDTVEAEPEPPAIDGSIYKKKVENTRWKYMQSGSDAVIPFQAAGQMHYSVVNSGLVSVAGFSTALLTSSLYEGQDVLFENQTGNSITLKDMFSGVSTPFNFGADLVVPNGGKLWLRLRNGEFELIMKSWNDPIDLSTKADLVSGKVPASQLPAYVDDVLEYANLAAFPGTGETGKIYLALDTNKTYRWSGSVYIELGGGANKQIFQWWGGNWSTPTLGNYYYISYAGGNIEGLNNSISMSMNGRNKGLFIAPFNCKIKRVMFKEGGSGSYTGAFVLASGLPNYGGTWNNGYSNIVTHINQAISATGYEQHKNEYLVTDNITVPKGYAVCPMLVFSAQVGASKVGIEISIEIEEVI